MVSDYISDNYISSWLVNCCNSDIIGCFSQLPGEIDIYGYYGDNGDYVLHPRNLP